MQESDMMVRAGDGFPPDYFYDMFTAAGLINRDTGRLQPDATQVRFCLCSWQPRSNLIVCYQVGVPWQSV